MHSGDFVTQDSIVRKIWGKSDTILFIFAGSAGEFALNKAVDWLYFTGKLPSDPIGRLFSTVAYARMIVFSETEKANAAIDRINSIHKGVEQARQATIPDWAYRDVLFMLIHYSIASYELLERKLCNTEKEEVYNVFYRVGLRMGLNGLPVSYQEWLPVREQHMQNNLARTEHSLDLFKQYKKHLGAGRYIVLKESQKMVMPRYTKKLLALDGPQWLRPTVPIYKWAKKLRVEGIVRNLLLPARYKEEIEALNIH